MKLDILNIGDELLIGQTLNTNAQWISKELNSIGFEIRQQLTISDTEKAILNAVEESLNNVDVLLVTGGLGPTNDDLTMPVLMKYFGGELVRNQEVYKDIEQLVLSRGYQMNKNNESQAMVPTSSKAIRNAHGTAPGLWFEKGNKVVVAMPGVPYEMRAMVANTVIPWLKEKFEFPEILHQMVYTQGIPESMLAEKIESWEKELPLDIKLAYLPSPGRVKLRLSTKGSDRAQLHAKISSEVSKLTKLIPQYIYSDSEEKIQRLIGEKLKFEGATVVTAESCTGGYIAHLITEIAGSSDYYLGSILSYANEVKINQLGVSIEDLNQYGAVSEQVVVQMANGAKNKLAADYAIATSGIAGPSGGTDEKPVGTVWIAIATPKGTFAEKHSFGKQRKVNIERAAVTALGLLLKQLG
jgi:nicotinamide-nucleotide amidase